MINWLKQNRLIAVLVLIVVYLAFDRYRYYLPTPLRVNNKSADFAVSESVSFGSAGAPSRGISNSLIAEPAFEPVSDFSERVVIQNSNLSLLVSDVRETGDKIIDFANSKGGFMVNASYNRPEESAFADISVRVPTDNLDEALDFYRRLSVKVTNEYIQGRDVTEQYVNIEERLATLEKTKTKFEQILDSATKVQDILQVQRELSNMQRQIDSLVGQRESIENNAALTKITVYLSTDELSLPYTPDNKFRPNVIFKLAIRSMVGSLQSVGAFIIWTVAYSVIWIPAAAVIYFARKYWMKRKI